MANYVLVHGAWGGGQTYDKTVPDLEGAGHNVLVATLPGLGTRQGELHPGITLTEGIRSCYQWFLDNYDTAVAVRSGAALVAP